MKNIENMKLELNQDLARARILAETPKAEGRKLTESEREKLDVLMTRIQRQELAINEEEGLQDNERKIAAPVTATGTLAGGDEKSYRNLFNEGRSVAPEGDFRTFGDFLQVVHSGRFDERLESRQHEVGTGELGGFSVPIEHAEFLLDRSLEEEIVRPRAKVYPMKHSEIRIPKWQTPDHSGGEIYGGLQGIWINELGDNVEQTGSLEMVTLIKNKLAIFSSISNELVYDSPSFERELGMALRRGIGYFMDSAFISGTGPGGGQPMGVLSDPALITVARNTGGSIVLDDIINMFAALYKGPFANPIWICNHDVIPELMRLQDPTNKYVWQPNASEKISGRLYGYPVFTSEKVPAMAGAGSIILADFQHYAVGLGPDIFLEKNVAPGWSRDFTSYRAIVRVDGCGLWSAPMTTASGGNLSWCVTLDA